MECRDLEPWQKREKAVKWWQWRQRMAITLFVGAKERLGMRGGKRGSER